MKVSLNTIREYVDFDLSVSELVAKINQQLGGVEEVIDLGSKYKDALIVKVAECEKHPDADRLNVCKIDAGQSGLVQVVCGAPNVHAGMWAVWLPPGSIVPSTFGDQNPFVLEARELRGVMSNGMLASPKELAISEEHEGILEITDEDLASGKQLTPGASFAEVFDLNDTIIDIENKMFTHRPDLFGQLGVAREIFAITRIDLKDTPDETRFNEPDWYWKIPQFEKIDEVALDVFNEVPELAPRFYACAMKGAKVAKSPLWLQTTLIRWGGKPINNIVDLTNYVMLLTAQPTHAYDLSKLSGNKIGVRMAKPGEKIALLNGREYDLTDTDVVIADADKAIGLAGIMGGSDTEVDTNTTDIVLEVANFNMYTIRRSSMRHGLFTDALTRFNKGQSPLQNERVMFKLVGLMQKIVGAVQVSPVYCVPESSDDKTTISGQIDIEPRFVNDRLGLKLNDAQIGNLLRYVNFASYNENGKMAVTAPFWRMDIESPEDIVEEVGRLYGFDKLPQELPKRTLTPAKHTSKQITKQKIRNFMTKAGANEVLTYSFVHEKLMKNAEQDTAQAFQLGNALSPELQYFRLSVLPSLLNKVHMNIKAGHNEFVLYEIGKGHNKQYHANDDDGLPSEMEFVDGVYASKDARPGAAYYYVRTLVAKLGDSLGAKLVFKPISEELEFPVTAPFEQGRSSLVETEGGVFVGMVGELRQSVRQAFKLPDYCAAFTLDQSGLNKVVSERKPSYLPLPNYPKTTQDITLTTEATTSFSQIETKLVTTLKESGYEFDLSPIGVFKKADEASKNTSFRLKLWHPDKTLTTEEVNTLLAQLIQVVGVN